MERRLSLEDKVRKEKSVGWKLILRASGHILLPRIFHVLRLILESFFLYFISLTNIRPDMMNFFNGVEFAHFGQVIYLGSIYFIMQIKQHPVPQVEKVFTLTHPQSFSSIDTWKNTITARMRDKDSLSLFMKGYENTIIQLYFEGGCLIYKKSYKILHARHQVITTLCHLTDVKDVEYLGIGYDDGVVEVYEFRVGEDSAVLIKLYDHSTKLLKKRQPVVNILYNKNCIVVGYLYHVVVLQSVHLFSKKFPTNMKEKLLPLYFLDTHTKIDIACSRASDVVIYNELNGCVTVEHQGNQCGRIQDSVRVFHQVGMVEGDVIMIGSSDNCVKFINYAGKRICRWKGWKNYVCCVCEDVKRGILWVGTLEGVISCFRFHGENLTSSEKEFTLHEKQLSMCYRVLPDAILNIFVCGALLIIRDCEQNVHVFDIVDQNQHSSSIMS